MSGTISAGGLITGLDSNSIITQLLALERRPITKLQQQITALQAQQSATRDLRTQLLALRNAAQDFKFNNAFNQFSTASSEPAVLTSEVSGTPVIGAYALNVTQLASSTVATSSAKLGAAMNPAATLNSSGISGSITAGTFTINGVQFSVDPATDSLNTLIGNINASSAGVTASYDAVTDKLTISNTTAGNTRPDHGQTLGHPDPNQQFRSPSHRQLRYLVGHNPSRIEHHRKPYHRVHPGHQQFPQCH
ncbi:MAG: hypothetical protein HZB26_18440 [Candidatus Hydrogenedentes bacterium]|nr:hypothetical protein [Candidatus Hydrogenedentota bacterium]